MEKASWFERGKETWRVTWPLQVIIIIIFIIFFSNLIYLTITDSVFDNPILTNIFNGLCVSSVFILSGLNYHYYRDHYHNMAIKHNNPVYDKLVKLGKWQIAVGAILFIGWILIWISM